MKKIILLLLLTFITGTSLYAQTSTEVVWEQLQDAYDEAYEMGYSVKNYIIGGLDSNEDVTWFFSLNAFTNYRLVSVCDEDCADIDLYIYDSDENLIYSNTEEDNTPVLTLTPTESGVHKIKISMYACSLEPCYYGLGIYEQ